jgi:ABC-2 type transport system permease protein
MAARGSTRAGTHAGDSAQQRVPDEAARGLVPRPSLGPLGGFRNLAGKENKDWVSGFLWLVHGVIWLVIVAGTPLVVSFVRTRISPDVTPKDVNDTAALLFFVMASVSAVIAVVVRSQGAIVGEKQLGTAAWVLSKPASRRAFVLAKLAVHARWLTLLTVLVPAVMVYVSLPSISGRPLPLLPFLGGVGMMVIALIFYLALSLLLGTIFESRGPVAGSVFGFLVGGLLLSNYAGWLTAIFPWLFFENAYYLSERGWMPATGISAIVATTVWSVVFVVLALWRFERAEV